ncbi:MAG: hypothetical protein JSS81_20615 [Acidobacteria bacterium]|nr:hypothetical protein [Acidobacteriota bacterium]
MKLKSKKILETADLGRLFLYFSNCPKTGIYLCRLYAAGVEIKPQRLKMNGSVEFESNLSDLIWTDYLSSFQSPAKNLDAIPVENIYFYAVIPVLKNVLPGGARLPEDYLSNQLTVSFRSK